MNTQGVTSGSMCPTGLPISTIFGEIFQCELRILSSRSFAGSGFTSPGSPTPSEEVHHSFRCTAASSVVMRPSVFVLIIGIRKPLVFMQNTMLALALVTPRVVLIRVISCLIGGRIRWSPLWLLFNRRFGARVQDRSLLQIGRNGRGLCAVCIPLLLLRSLGVA